ncbi:hypothetical protein [Sedimenticola selenatireducens]|uniref:hypothetical protein n=1 Tax=Sedimenticola selenatireducens TaxID=191960 RepID=UPI0004904C36|nr:hypothetical protein [Sedimenticola selenatireducens]
MSNTPTAFSLRKSIYHQNFCAIGVDSTIVRTKRKNNGTGVMQKRTAPLFAWFLSILFAALIVAGLATYSKLKFGDIWYFLS